MQKTFLNYLPHLLLIGCILGLLGLLYSFTFVSMAKICWNNDDYSHGLFLPFAAGYLIWLRRNALLAAWNEPSMASPHITARILGSVLLMAGCLLVVITRSMHMQDSVPQWLSFYVIVSGIFLLSLRPKVVALVLPPILLCFMAKPIPDSMVPRLFNPFQAFAASVSAKVLDKLNVPVHSEGNVIEIPGMRLLVEEACSGMRSLMALTTVALIVLMVIPFPRWIQLLVFGFSIFLALFLNVVRVAATGVLAYFVSHELATGFFHTFSGLVVFFVGLIILFSISNKIADVLEKRNQSSSPEKIDTEKVDTHKTDTGGTTC